VPGGVYAIRNVLNGHEYIGHSVRVLGRWRLHQSCLRRGKHHSSHLQHAWDKYGERVFEFVPLAVDGVPWTARELVDLEQDYVDFFLPEYNVCKECVTSLLGVRLTEEHKTRIGVGQRGKAMSPEARAKISVAQRGVPESLAAIEARASAQRGVPNSPETRARISAANKGRILSNEHKEKLRAHWRVPENRAKRSEAVRASWPGRKMRSDDGKGWKCTH